MASAKGRLIVLGASLLLLCSAGFGNVITFNGLPGNGAVIPNGYAGFNWGNFYSQQMPVAASNLATATSTESFAYNNGPAWFGSTSAFTFTSAMLSTDGSKYFGLEVLGLRNGIVVDRSLLTLSSSTPTMQNFNWSGINEVRFVPQGLSAKLPFAMQALFVNIPSVPEPTSFMLLASGIGLALTSVRRRFK